MKKRSCQTDKRMLFCIVCLFFLFGSLGGALAANLLKAAQKAELAAFLETALFPQKAATFWHIFWKYLKYDLLIWLGGWTTAGVFVSGAAFLFRSIAVGFTSAALLTAYGVKGIWTAVTAFLPQNLLLIPTYSVLMTAAVYYLLSAQNETGKRALKRERRRRRVEYCILFAGSVVLLLLAAGIEQAVIL